MKVSEFVSNTLHGLSMAAASLAVLQLSAGQVLAVAPAAARGPRFRRPLEFGQ